MNDEKHLAQDDEHVDVDAGIGGSSDQVEQKGKQVGRSEAERLERAIQLEAESAATGAKLKAELKQLYDRTARHLRRMVNDFYGRYAVRGSSKGAERINGFNEMAGARQVLPYDQAVKQLKTAEIKEWKDSIALQADRIDKESDPSVRERLQAKLKGITCGTSPPNSRFDVLSGHMRMALDKLDVAGAQQMGRAFESLLLDVYAKKIFDTKQRNEEQFGDKEMRDDRLDAEEIAKVLSNPWNGTTFPERLTFNMNKLHYHLRETMVQGLIQGKSSSAVVKDLAARMGASFKQVERIIDTESAYFHSEATLLAYRASGVKHYKYVSKMDKRTSAECRELDGQLFEVSDAKIGVNFPPLHEGCRSITVEIENDMYESRMSGLSLSREVTYEPKDRIEGTGNVSEGDPYVGGSGGIDATPSTIKYLEDMIKTEEFEHGVVFDRNGNVLSNLITDNHPTKINFSSYKDQIKDAIVTHNHPTNGMFSWQDFETAIAFDASEIRAALPSGVTFSMKRGPNGWNVPYYDVRDIFENVQSSFRNNPEIMRIYREEGYARVNDMLMEVISVQIGGIYNVYK
ncbi:minor capsid protein [Paenibacillus assamensis]|uniref:minor capsid protein n=1 Tax=Paenibacillus assamensis TaxID=311244 RepID=UPI00040E99F7|nr:minor capsid protein [Paenibacillus assamensis]